MSALLVAVLVAVTPEPQGSFEQVPVGIAASKDGRVFLAFSRAIDPKQKLSVAEVKGAAVEPFPPGFVQADGAPEANRLLSVQSVYVDAKHRLWILDCAKVGTNEVEPGTAKLIAWDLKANKEALRIDFPKEIAGRGSFLNDVRVDVKREVAFVTDASSDGPNGIVVIDLATKKVTRRLGDHPSTKADPKVTLKVEGKPLIQKGGPTPGAPFKVGADGIALTADGKWLYWSPLTSHGLYRIDTAVLTDAAKKDADVAKAVEDLGDKGFASDGLEVDAQGRLYATDFEHGTVQRRSEDGKWKQLTDREAISWPDTFAFMPDGRLLVTATQIHRGPRMQGMDQRKKPFVYYALTVTE